jgi:hypothetical protein
MPGFVGKHKVCSSSQLVLIIEAITESENNAT